jgi:uncharacterized membrane protein YjjP (DUF1212 family)
MVRPGKLHAVRPLWEYIHKGIGYGAVLLAVPTIVFGLIWTFTRVCVDGLTVNLGSAVTGLRQVNATVVLEIAYGAVAGVLAIVFLALQYRTSASRRLYAEITPLIGGMR